MQGLAEERTIQVTATTEQITEAAARGGVTPPRRILCCATEFSAYPQGAVTPGHEMLKPEQET
jgi:hypothetical protein